MEATCTSVEFATVSDAVEISELSRKHIEYNLRWTYKPTRIREIIQNASKNVIVARKNHSLVGFGIMTYREDSANLDLLAVKRQYRRQGVGRQIVQWLEEVALISGIMNIFVQVRKTNYGAIRFYENQGFHFIEETAGYYQGRESCVIMCKGIRQMIGNLKSIDTKGYYQ